MIKMFFVILLLIIPFLSSVGKNLMERESYIQVAPKANDNFFLTPHAPILIMGNENFTEINGVVGGNGTKGNPYIIEGWDINAITSNGIEVRNTNAYFVIKNCYIHDGSNNDEYNDGILLSNVTNGCIEKCDIIKNDVGISLNECPKLSNKIRNCNISYNINGIMIYDCHENNITSCSICNNKNTGIIIYYSSKNLILQCNIKNNGEEGVFIGSTIRGIDYPYASPLLSESRSNIILNCNISNNHFGVEMHRRAKDNHITRCRIDNNICGIGVYHSPTNNTIAECDILKNGIGIWIRESSNQNYIYRNNFMNNKIQAFDRCFNIWDDGSAGNYWDNYHGFDFNRDGIGDIPKYIFGGLNWDNYPLMKPWGQGFSFKPSLPCLHD